MGLTQEQLDQFHRDGCLVIPNFFSAEKAKELVAEANKLVEEFDLASHPKTVFTASNGRPQTGEDYFLNSGDKVRFFFEDKAFKGDQLAVDKSKSINKIGHALHMHNPLFRDFTFQSEVKEISKQLQFSTPAVLQSMVIFKQPFIGGEVCEHQDSTFLYTEPLSAIGFWFALEDCTLDNGCLHFLPGSHKDGIHGNRRFIRARSGEGVEFTSPPVPYDGKDFVSAECKAGTLVLIHGSVVHKSEENTSPRSRVAYTFHVIEDPRGGKHVYPPDNWLQPTPEAPFSLLYEEN